MLPTYRNAEGSYYRETEREGPPHHQTEKDPSGYCMVNTLESIGAISRKYMYRVACSTKGACTVELDDDTICHLSGQKLNEVILAGLRACGEISEQNIRTLALLPVHEVG